MTENNIEAPDKNRISTARKWVMAIARGISFPIVDLFFKVFNRSQVIGAENIPKTGGALFASNHVSGVDTILIPAFAIRRFSTMPFMAPGKEELFAIPIVRSIISIWGSFAVKRRSRDIESMKRIAYYANNYQVMIFPEGTRSRNGELLRGRSGVGWIIYKARPVVIPTLVINTDHYFWPGRKTRWFKVPYTVVFGEPMNLDPFYEMPDSKATSQAISDAIMSEIAKLRMEHQPLYIDPPLLTGFNYEREKA